MKKQKIKAKNILIKQLNKGNNECTKTNERFNCVFKQTLPVCV